MKDRHCVVPDCGSPGLFTLSVLGSSEPLACWTCAEHVELVLTESLREYDALVVRWTTAEAVSQ